jgi:hypothetical protein
MRYLLFALLAFLVACSRTGSIDGDVFEAKSGVVTRGAGVPLYILTPPDSIRAEMRRACDAFHAGTRALTSADIDRYGPLKNEMLRSVGKLLRNQRRMNADINGHFHINSLEPGVYVLFAVDASTMKIWIDTVRVPESAAITHDLPEPNDGEMMCSSEVLLHATGARQ